MKPPEPMEALLAEILPEGPEWTYEPKWDGFRCLVAKQGKSITLWSKSGKRLDRYFPDIVSLFEQAPPSAFLIDGELLIEQGGRIAFDALQLRLHPATSRVAKLAAATPAMFMAFDCLASGGHDLAGQPLAERRAALETLFRTFDHDRLKLSPSTRDRDRALGWLERTGGALDGVIAKRVDQPYAFGERTMVKVKATRTADCVVGGFRYAAKGEEVGSLLLGLYDDDGKLDHVGFTSALKGEDKPALTKRLEKLAGGSGFTGKAPGGPSRWSTERSADWVPLKPELVVEVRYDQVTGGRFRHGTALVRWRPDKAPRQCTRQQLAPPLTPRNSPH